MARERRNPWPTSLLLVVAILWHVSAAAISLRSLTSDETPIFSCAAPVPAAFYHLNPLDVLPGPPPTNGFVANTTVGPVLYETQAFPNALKLEIPHWGVKIGPARGQIPGVIHVDTRDPPPTALRVSGNDRLVFFVPNQGIKSYRREGGTWGLGASLVSLPSNVRKVEWVAAPPSSTWWMVGTTEGYFLDGRHVTDGSAIGGARVTEIPESRKAFLVYDGSQAFVVRESVPQNTVFALGHVSAPIVMRNAVMYSNADGSYVYLKLSDTDSIAQQIVFTASIGKLVSAILSTDKSRELLVTNLGLYDFVVTARPTQKLTFNLVPNSISGAIARADIDESHLLIVGERAKDSIYVSLSGGRSIDLERLDLHLDKELLEHWESAAVNTAFGIKGLGAVIETPIESLLIRKNQAVLTVEPTEHVAQDAVALKGLGLATQYLLPDVLVDVTRPWSEAQVQPPTFTSSSIEETLSHPTEFSIRVAHPCIPAEDRLYVEILDPHGRRANETTGGRLPFLLLERDQKDSSFATIKGSLENHERGVWSIQFWTEAEGRMQKVGHRIAFSPPTFVERMLAGIRWPIPTAIVVGALLLVLARRREALQSAFPLASVWGLVSPATSAIRATGAGLVFLLSPLRYVWPWLLTNGVFWLFLSSPQGEALAHGFSAQPVSAQAIVGLSSGTFLLIAVSVVFTTIAVAGGNDGSDEEPRTGPDLRTLSTVWHACWTIGLAATPVVLFAYSTRSHLAWIEFAALLILSSFVAMAAVSSLRRERHWWKTFMRWVNGHHLVAASALLAVAVIPLAAGALVAISNPERLSDAGPLLIAMLGLFALATFVGLVLIAIPASLRRPWLGGVVALYFVARWASPVAPMEDASRMVIRSKAEARSACPASPSPDKAQDAVLRRNQKGLAKDWNDVVPKIYMVSAEGGGIRAAYWTAIGLAELDQSTGGRFGRNVVALSGVSGGSLGVATWLGAREVEPDSLDQQLQIAKTFLAADFLSPSLAGLLFLDAPRLALGRVWFSTDRGAVFEKDLTVRWRKVARGSDFFDRRMDELCLRSFQDHPPAVVFNATNAVTGAPEFLTNVTELARAPGMSVKQAVQASASFPFLSPSTDVLFDEIRLKQELSASPEAQISRARSAIQEFAKSRPDARARILVDGGYFDNTGLEFIDRFKKELENLPSPAMSSGDPIVAEAVGVHFANALDEDVCLRPDLTGLPPESVHMINEAQALLPCRSDIEVLRHQVGRWPFEWAVTPLFAMFAARDYRSFETRVGAEQTMQISLAQEMAFAQQILQKSDLLNAEEQTPEAVNSKPDWQNGDGSHHIYGLGPLSSRYSFAHSDEAQRYARFSTEVLKHPLERERKLAKCALETIQTMQDLPPLGWALNDENRAQLSCLAALAALHAEALAPKMFARGLPLYDSLFTEHREEPALITAKP